MQIQTFTHQFGVGWSSELPSELDSDQTLLVAFGASEYGDAPAALAELAAAFPRSARAGCSSASEILGQVVTDHSLVVAAVRLDRKSVV